MKSETEMKKCVESFYEAYAKPQPNSDDWLEMIEEMEAGCEYENWTADEIRETIDLMHQIYK